MTDLVRSTTRSVGALAVAFALGAPVACASEDAANDAAHDAAAGLPAIGFLARAECRSCVIDEKCFREARACELDPGCSEWLSCTQASDANACSDTGAASGRAVESCAHFYCETACFAGPDCRSDEGIAQCRQQLSMEPVCASAADAICSVCSCPTLDCWADDGCRTFMKCAVRYVLTNAADYLQPQYCGPVVDELNARDAGGAFLSLAFGVYTCWSQAGVVCAVADGGADR